MTNTTIPHTCIMCGRVLHSFIPASESFHDHVVGCAPLVELAVEYQALARDLGSDGAWVYLTLTRGQDYADNAYIAWNAIWRD